MKYGFKELVDIKALQDLTDELYRTTGIPSSVITMEGDILTGSGWQRICTEFHRKHPEIEKTCIESDTRIREELKKGEPFVMYRCPHGLMDGLSPIVIEEEHVANVFVGQLFTEPPTAAQEEAFRQQAKKYGFDEKAYMEAFREIPIVSRERFSGALAFLSQLARLIAGLGLTRMRELDALDALKKTEERLSLTLKSARMGTFVWDIVTNRRIWDENTHLLLGTRPETFSGSEEDFFRVIHPDDRKAVKTALVRAMESKVPYETEYRAIWPDGSIHHIAARGQVCRDPAGRSDRMIGVCWDVTAQKTIEQELRVKGDELEKQVAMMFGREKMVIELRNEVDEALKAGGRPPKYNI